MSRFNPEHLGLSEFVRGQLLEGDEDLKGMRTELYKLNVYGQCLLLVSMSYYCDMKNLQRQGLFLQVT